MTYDKAAFKSGSLQPLPNRVEVLVGNDETMAAAGTGEVELHSSAGRVLLQKVLWVPSLAANLLSFSQLMKKGFRLTNSKDAVFLRNSGGALVSTGQISEGLLRMNLRAAGGNGRKPRLKGLPRLGPAEGSSEDERAERPRAFMARSPGVGRTQEGASTHTSNTASPECWHQRLNHVGGDHLQATAAAVHGMVVQEGTVRAQGCNDCNEWRMTCQSFPARPPGEERERKAPLALIHSDYYHGFVCSYQGYTMFMTFLDEVTGYLWCTPLKTRSAAALVEAFREWIPSAANQSGQALRMFRADRAGEYLSAYFQGELKERGVVFQCSAPRMSQQAGKAERVNRTISEAVKAMLGHAGLPNEYWPAALAEAVWIYNRTVKGRDVTKTPYEWFTGVKPSLASAKVFGCMALYYVPEEDRYKHEARARWGLYLGHSPESKAWLFVNHTLVGHVVPWEEQPDIPNPGPYSFGIRWQPLGGRPVVSATAAFYEHLNYSQWMMLRRTQPEFSDSNVRAAEMQLRSSAQEDESAAGESAEEVGAEPQQALLAAQKASAKAVPKLRLEAEATPAQHHWGSGHWSRRNLAYRLNPKTTKAAKEWYQRNASPPGWTDPPGTSHMEWTHVRISSSPPKRGVAGYGELPVAVQPGYCYRKGDITPRNLTARPEELDLQEHTEKQARLYLAEEARLRDEVALIADLKGWESYTGKPLPAAVSKQEYCGQDEVVPHQASKLRYLGRPSSSSKSIQPLAFGPRTPAEAGLYHVLDGEVYGLADFSQNRVQREGELSSGDELAVQHPSAAQRKTKTLLEDVEPHRRDSVGENHPLDGSLQTELLHELDENAEPAGNHLTNKGVICLASWVSEGGEGFYGEMEFLAASMQALVAEVNTRTHFPGGLPEEPNTIQEAFVGPMLRSGAELSRLSMIRWWKGVPGSLCSSLPGRQQWESSGSSG